MKNYQEFIVETTLDNIRAKIANIIANSKTRASFARGSSDAIMDKIDKKKSRLSITKRKLVKTKNENNRNKLRSRVQDLEFDIRQLTVLAKLKDLRARVLDQEQKTRKLRQ